jgi:nitrate/TMAO reductase-like tetraheme cytochrome c subunit
MANDDTKTKILLRRLLNYASNPTTVLGAILTTVSALLIIVFAIHDLISGLENPYAAVFSYLFLPIFFLLGLLVIPIGMWRQRRRLLAAGADLRQLASYPRLDFNDPQLRRITLMLFGMTVVNAVILGSTAYLGVEYTETVDFCGTVCHTVMQPEYAAYQHSPHSRVKCVECHIGPGAPWFVRAKLDGIRQVWRTLLDLYDRPIPSPVHALRPAQETCEECHWPEKHYGDRLRIYGRFALDEDNTPMYSAMLLKTGGGSLDLGRHSGIHWWHIYSDNRIRYAATDERRQEIVWVEFFNDTATTEIYTREGDELPSAQDLESEARVMDCIDCHNRPTHLFQSPSKAVDELLERHPELVQLPYLKKEALNAMLGEYPTHETGVQEVRRAILEFYRTEYPKLARNSDGLLELAADSVASLYGRSVFPEMNVTWGTHTNNVGHEDFPGCNRCHDDEMMTADGDYVISEDCELCHTFLVEDSPTPPDLALLIED